jgi:hypothetical protein
MADIFNLGKYPLIPLAIGERSIYELGTDFGYDDCLTAGALDCIFDKSTPLANRVPAPGDFLDIPFKEGTPGMVRFYISYSGFLDTYTLLPCTMGNSSPVPPPPVPGPGTVILAGNATWTGGGTSITISAPGVLETDLYFVSIASYGTSTGIVTASPVDVVGGGSFDIVVNSAETTNSLVVSYMVIRPN